MSSVAATGLPHLPQTMRRWVYTDTHNGLENNLTLEVNVDVPASSLGSLDLLVRVTHATLNPADYKVPELMLGPLRRFVIPIPATPGMDFSGEIVRLGKDSPNQGGGPRFKTGQRIFGRLPAQQYGTLSEYIVVGRDDCALIPEQVEPAHAACISTAALTALQSMAPCVDSLLNYSHSPRSSDSPVRVFINGGSGGVGSFAIQIAKELGCHVTVSCSRQNVDLCRDLGADEVIEYTEVDVCAVLKEQVRQVRGPSGQHEAKTEPRYFDLVVDNVGGSPHDLYKACNEILHPRGRFVQIGGDTTFYDLRVLLDRALRPGFLGGGRRSWRFLQVQTRQADMARIAAWMSEGKVRAIIDGDSVFKFGEVREAVKRLKARGTRGKVVVAVVE